MKKNQEHIDETILLKVIENVADENERSLFTSWHNRSTENAKIFEQLKKTHHLVSIDTNSLHKNWESVVRKVNAGTAVPEYIELPGMRTFSIHSRMNTLIRIAAMLIILLGISFLIKLVVFDPEQLIVSARDLNPNEPYHMADGSLVYLNGNSEITFSKKFGIKNRKLSLSGEAFFEVQRNEEIPFSIKTNKTTTRVLGTSFNVYSDQTEQVRVSVVSGLVEFFTDAEKNLVRLEAGEQGTYNPVLEGIKKESITNQNFLAWKTGILYFDETPVEEAFSLIKDQYSRMLVFEEEQNVMPTLTTTIDNQPLEAVLEELNLLLNTNYKTRNDTIFFKPNS